MRFSDIFQTVFRKKAITVTEPALPRHSRQSSLVQVVSTEQVLAPGTPRYPPIDSGIAVVPATDLIESQVELVRLLRRNVGLPEPEFERKYLQPIRRVAHYVNLLPATRDKHHASAGGLFRYALTLAVRCSQSAEGRIFAASEGIERRRQTEDAWRYAAFLTGLTSELFRPLTEMLIVDDSGQEWSPFVSGLTQWAESNGSTRFFVRWHQRDDARSVANSLSSWAVSAIVGNEILAEIHSVKPAIVETMFGVASGSITTADNSTLAGLINEVRRKVIEQDHDIQPTTYGRLTSGSHLEPYFLDAIRSLLRTGVWQVNTKAARCHYGTDGFFIAWRQGAQDILGQLAKEKIAGVPTSRDTLAEMLGKAGIIKPAPDGSWVYLARSSVVSDSTFPAILLIAPSAVIGHLDITPIKATLRVSQAKNTDKTSSLASKVVPDSAVASAPAISPKPPETPFATSPVADAVEVATKDSTQSPPKAPASTTPAAPVGVDPAGVSAPIPNDKRPEAQKNNRPQSQRDPNSKASPPRGAIVAAPEHDEEESEPIDKALLMQLGAPICRELGHLRDRWNRGQDAQDFLRTPTGLAISWGALNSCAIPFAKITEALSEGGYVQTSSVSGRTRIMQPLPFPRGEQLGIVLLTAIARKAGFTLE